MGDPRYASEWGAKSEVAHKWAKWLPHPCRIGDRHRFKVGGHFLILPTSGQSGYLTTAVSGIPTAAERGAKSEVAHKWAKWLATLHHLWATIWDFAPPLCSGGDPRYGRGEVATLPTCGPLG